MLRAVADRFAIAQVAPHPLEDANEVGTFATEVSRELAGRGHRVLLLAPSRSPSLVRESRKLIRAARERPESLFDPDGDVRVLGVGELLFPSRRKGINPAPPVDIARTIEEVLGIAPLDFVHVHEPWAPSAGSVALRHSRALNVGSFHQPVERVLSTQVARRFVELFFGRLDARTASYEATAELLNRYFPASYRLLRPGVTPLERARARRARCGSRSPTARSAARCGCSCARCGGCRRSWPWEAVIYSKTGAVPTLRSSLRNRVHVVDDEQAGARGRRRRRRRLARARTRRPACWCGRSAPARSRWPRACRSTRRCSRDGDLGLHFQAGDVAVLAEQLERLVRDDELRAGLVEGGRGGARGALVGARRRRGRGDLRRARRAAPRPRPEAGGPRAGQPSAS